jgi:hypothetical protein
MKQAAAQMAQAAQAAVSVFSHARNFFHLLPGLTFPFLLV